MTDPGLPQPTASAAPELQFDRVESTLNASVEATASHPEGIPCSSCGTVMLDAYYSIGGKSICASCRTSVETTRATSRTPKAFAKALGFGLGAALAGAGVYYAVIALLDLEIGIVAILIGWMVGRAIQKALPGGGSRRYQLLAAVLTYFAVGAAYLPLVFGEMRKNDAATQQDSTAVLAQQGKPTASPSPAPVVVVDESGQKESGSLLLGLGGLVVLAFSLPVMTIFSGGSGIISALIIGIGMRQAWQMSGAPALTITGPFRLSDDAMAVGTS